MTAWGPQTDEPIPDYEGRGGGADPGEGLERDERGRGVYDAVLFATGRTPNTADMGLEGRVEVEIGARRGGARSSSTAYSQTSVPSILRHRQP